MSVLVNIDNGGTFTDVCVRRGDAVFYAKSPTTPHDLTQCFVHALSRVARDIYGDEDLARLVREIDYLRYSTTSGTNAVVERKGTPAALLVEQGEETSVYGVTKRLGDDTLWASMVPVPPAGIAVAADGSMDERELIRVVNDLLSRGARRLVVALRSDAAERRVKTLLLDRYPRHLLGAVPFLLSYELVNDSDHCRRVLSALLNSYLHPGMEHFLYGAEKICKQHHLAHPLLIYRNDGNSARVAKTTAIKTWGSGPRGGLQGAIAYAELYGERTLLAMDIGGTTTDVAVILDGGVRLNAHGRIDSTTTSFAMPQLESFGYGGSSVVRVKAGRLMIGPDSVGAVPGPACFGRGGTEPTLTDALLLAGVIDADNYLGGELRLDAARAHNAIRQHVALPLGIAVKEAVERMVRGFEADVADLLTASLVAAGRKPAEATLLAYGGGGPMIACGIAAKAGMRRVIVPQMAAVFSAFGIGFSDLAHEYRIPAGGDIDALQESMLQRARRDMAGEGVDATACSYAFSSWIVDDEAIEQRPFSPGDAVGGDAYLHLKASFKLPAFHLATDSGTRTSNPQPSQRGEGGLPIYAVDAVAPGSSVSGPALLRSNYLTCLVDPGWSLRVTDNHDLIIQGA